jgi:hypothetical protein
VSIGHSAAFTWDGELLVFGHEPGGGVEARCQATSAPVDRTAVLLRRGYRRAGGQLPPPAPAVEPRELHLAQHNVVPTGKRYALVSGSYQAGISVVDFTDPANAREVAFADPAPLSGTSLVSGGDWSSYWYDGRIYESDMRRGLIVWNLSDSSVAGARRLGHLNPQTQETSFSRKGN